MIVFNGTSSDEVGVIVEHYPDIIIPEKKVEVFKVPGRNGDIVIDHGAFENYDQKYNVFLDSERYGGVPAVLPKLTSWLFNANGYQRLEDSYFPDFYRMAYISNAHEFTSFFNIYGRGDLVFNCAPEKYYKSGEDEINIYRGQTLVNPSDFKAYPIIYINVRSGSYSGSMHFTSNGITKSVTFGVSNEHGTTLAISNVVEIDVKNHTIKEIIYRTPYKEYSESDISAEFSGDFESLMLDKETTITWDDPPSNHSSTTLAVSIVPNWWTI